MTEIPQQNPDKGTETLKTMYAEARDIEARLKQEEEIKADYEAEAAKSGILEKALSVDKEIYKQERDSRMFVLLKRIELLDKKYENLPEAKSMKDALMNHFVLIQQNRGLKEIGTATAIKNSIKNQLTTAWDYDNKWGLTEAYLTGVVEGTISVGKLLIDKQTWKGLVRSMGLAIVIAADLVVGKKSPAEIKTQIGIWIQKINDGIAEGMRTVKPEEMASVIGITVGQVLAVDIGVAGVGKVAQLSKSFHVPELMVLGLENAGVIARLEKGAQTITAFSGRAMNLINDTKTMEILMKELKTIGESIKGSKLPKGNPVYQKLVNMQNVTRDLYNEITNLINLKKIKGPLMAPVKALMVGIKYFWDDIALAGIRSQGMAN